MVLLHKAKRDDTLYTEGADLGRLPGLGDLKIIAIPASSTPIQTYRQELFKAARDANDGTLPPEALRTCNLLAMLKAFRDMRNIVEPNGQPVSNWRGYMLDLCLEDAKPDGPKVPFEGRDVISPDTVDVLVDNLIHAWNKLDNFDLSKEQDPEGNDRPQGGSSGASPDGGKATESRRQRRQAATSDETPTPTTD